MQDIIATWFVADDKENATSFPSNGADSSLPAFQEVYWKCIVSFYVSARHFNPLLRMVFFSNVRNIPTVGGCNIAALFAKLDVEVVYLPITFRLPRSEGSKWGNQFYILDIMKYAASTLEQFNLCVLDSDVVCVADLSGSLFRRVSTAGLIVQSIDYPLDKNINGMTRRDMARVSCLYKQETKSSQPQDLLYFGGEFFCARSDVLKRLNGEVNTLWRFVMEHPGQIFEEAQFLSILIQANDITFVEQSSDIKRMWNGVTFSNMEDGDERYALWHLPAQKRYAFDRFFRTLTDVGFDLNRFGPDPFSKLQKVFGVPRFSRPQRFLNLVKKVAEKF